MDTLFIVLMVIQVEIYFVMSATLNGIWCIVTVSDLQQQQQHTLCFLRSYYRKRFQQFSKIALTLLSKK